MSKSINTRLLKDRLFYLVVIIIASIATLPLLSIIWELTSKGYSQLSLEFFTQEAPSSMEAMMSRASGENIPGGIVNGIQGTLYMVGLASLAALPAGIFLGIFLYGSKYKKLAHFLRFTTEMMQGLPSIVIGVVIYGLIVKHVTHSFSALAGSSALACMMLPLIVRSTEESLRMLPGSLKEAGMALGVPYPIVVFRVLLPASFSGLFTGILLALSRVLGETAPLILTALGSSAINWEIDSPTSAIPLLIWEFYNDPNLSPLIWSASLFLLFIILFLNLLSKHLAKKWKIN